MRTNDENKKLADILFPDVTESREDIFKKYPKREITADSMVLRFAPSPTGFLHIGGVFTSLISTWLARQTNGISILRIEDTDKSREVKGGVDLIVNGLKEFGISFDEGVMGVDKEIGEYGPYMQSKRLDIYKVFAKDMVSKGYAYPCFLTSDELEDIRKKQCELGERTGCYCDWAKWKNASLDEIIEKLDSGTDYVIRLNSTGDFNKTFELTDLVKGRVTLHENDMDAVLLKSDGYPTYHFAHPIDDTLMGITHIFRGDEWFSSVPLHVELFEKLGFTQLPYVHISPLMKLDNGNKRKLSKRKDPEASVEYYALHGYPTNGFVEYLLNLANSNFYDWRKQNPNADLEEFNLSIEKLNRAGALFDIVKLDDTCKEYIATLSAEELYDKALNWSEKHHEKLHSILVNNKEFCIKILNIERTGEKIRKDIVKYEDVYDQFKMFFDDLMEYEDISEKVSKDEQRKIIERYIENYTEAGSSDDWFNDLKKIAKELGYCTDRKEYEKNKEKYKGIVGDVAMVLRVALTGRTRTPDLYQIMMVLGKEKVVSKLKEYIGRL
ncbi:MAG: glutamate--tRNA ligase [Candidatus Dojkabacteria bacterium]|jgi:glutamyl-tRNA synthetase